MTKINKLLLPLIFLLVLLAVSNAKSPIKVHVILHSHLDEGWRYTFDQYYNGTTQDFNRCAKCIFDNVHESLKKNSSRKYVIAEVAFFDRWWNEQSSERKNEFRTLIQNKQVEFLGGGWSTNDEACAYYEDIIDQFILGHRWLKRELDVDSNIGWQIDSFGHSETHAALMAQAGYESLFFGRIHYKDWQWRRENRALDFNWRTQNPHNESIFGHVFFTQYIESLDLVYETPEESIPVDEDCTVIYCKNQVDLNMVSNFINYEVSAFPTNNILLLLGNDFYMSVESEKYFTAIEAMIQAFANETEKGRGLELRWSTPSDYLTALEQDLLPKTDEIRSLPEKYGDFFPYVDNQISVWTGYFTSKPMFKLRVREVSQYYNAAKLLLARFLLRNDSDDEEIHQRFDKALHSLEDPLGIVQHHDGISGTMKEAVKSDNYAMLKSGKETVNSEIVNILQNYSAKLLGEAADYNTSIDFDWLQKDEGLKLVFSDNKKVLVNVFNPGEKDKFLIKIRVPNSYYKVMNEQNRYLPCDIICHSKDLQDNCFVYFVDKIEAYSLTNYILQPSTLSKRVIPKDITEDLQLHIGNQVTFKVNKNLLDFEYSWCPYLESLNVTEMFLFNKQDCLEDSFNLNYEYYESYMSGAYEFLPKPDVDRQNFSSVQSGRVFRGRHLTLIQIFRDDMRTDLKIIHHELNKGIEVESYLDPVVDAPEGKEIVIMIRSKNVVNHDEVFHTDSNGYHMEKRQVIHSEATPTNPDMIQIPKNYYPITSAIYIEDAESNQRLTVMTDRAQGATCYKPGEVEIMIHRITKQDDMHGVDEALNEKDLDGITPLRVSTRHYIMYSSSGKGLDSPQRKRQYKMDRPLQLWFANTNASRFIESEVDSMGTKVLGLSENVKLYIRSYSQYEYIVRLHNLDDSMPKKVKIYSLESKLCDLLNAFSGRDDLKIDSVNELSLFTTKQKSEVKKNKFDWKATDSVNLNDGEELCFVELLPMEIRTFQIILQH